MDGSESLKTLGKLKKVGDLIINESHIEDLGELEVVEYTLRLSKKVKSLGKLKSVGHLYLENSILEDLGNLEKVKSINLEGNKKIKSLGTKINYSFNYQNNKESDKKH
jgi:hypothetical protein